MFVSVLENSLTFALVAFYSANGRKWKFLIVWLIRSIAPSLVAYILQHQYPLWGPMRLNWYVCFVNIFCPSNYWVSSAYMLPLTNITTVISNNLSMIFFFLLLFWCYIFCSQVRGVLQILQGFSSSIFCWGKKEQSYCTNYGIFVTHLSHTSLHAILGQFTYSATCLRMVEIVVNKVETYVKSPPPTLRAFTCSVSAWLRVCAYAMYY